MRKSSFFLPLLGPYRQERMIPVQEIAEVLQIDPSTVRRWESGRLRVRMKHLRGLCLLLEVKSWKALVSKEPEQFSSEQLFEIGELWSKACPGSTSEEAHRKVIEQVAARNQGMAQAKKDWTNAWVKSMESHNQGSQRQDLSLKSSPKNAIWGDPVETVFDLPQDAEPRTAVYVRERSAVFVAKGDGGWALAFERRARTNTPPPRQEDKIPHPPPREDDICTLTLFLDEGDEDDEE